MVRFRKCAVKGCKDTQSTRHRFPNPKKEMGRFQKWVEACGNTALTTVAPDLIYRSYRLCHVHFRTEDKSTNMYLQKGSKVVPMLHLPFPAPPTIDSLEVDIPTSTITHEIIEDALLEEQDVPLHVYSRQTKIAHDQPSTSTAEVIEEHASTSFSEDRDMICTTPVMDRRKLICYNEVKTVNSTNLSICK